VPADHLREARTSLSRNKK